MIEHTNMACPFMLPRNLARRFFRPNRAWPRWLRHKWVGLALFALLLFFYELFDLWVTPWWTAWLVVAYFVTPLVLDSFFKGAVFCKYVCPLGQFNFVASLVSPLEVKVRDLSHCAACRTKDCIKGRGETPVSGVEWSGKGEVLVGRFPRASVGSASAGHHLFRWVGG